MIGGQRHEFLSVGSTNDLAKAAALAGSEEGSVFIADHQTSGRGRRGAVWNDAPGESVLMSVLLYPAMPITETWRLGWLACIATINALAEFGILAKCKWPNDVMASGGKIAGVLVETVMRNGGGFAAVVGVGVNVKQTAFDDCVDYRLPPTSIRIASGMEPPDARAVADAICASLEALYDPAGLAWPEIAAAYRRSLQIGDVQSGIDAESGRPVVGILQDVRLADGAAVLIDPSGRVVFAYPTNNRDGQVPTT